MQGFLDFGVSLDSCITTTLTLLFSITTPSSVSLLPIPLALSCRTCCHHYFDLGVAGGETVGGGVEQWSHAQSLLLRYWDAFKSPKHFACTHPEHLLHWSLTPRLVTLRAQTGQGLDSDVRHPTSGGVGIEFGPVVFVAALWSWVGSVQPLRTYPRQKTRWDEQQTVRIVGYLDLQAIVCLLTVPPRVCRDLLNRTR